MKTYRHILAPLLVIGASILWGIIGIFTRALSEAGLSALEITAVRCAITAMVLLIYLVLTDIRKLKIKLRDIWLFVGTGVFSIVFFNICYFYCISESTLSVACILLYTSPCFVMLLSCIFLRERITVRKGIAAVLAFAGCMFVTGIIGSGSTMKVEWIVLAAGLGAGIGYALYSVIGKVAIQKYSWLTVITYTFLFASIALIPFCMTGEILNVVFSTGNAALSSVLLGVLSTLLPFLFYTKGLEHMDAGKAAILTFVEPVVATVIGIAVFNEAFTANTAIGIILVILSIVAINFKQKQIVATISE